MVTQCVFHLRMYVKQRHPKSMFNHFMLGAVNLSEQTPGLCTCIAMRMYSYSYLYSTDFLCAEFMLKCVQLAIVTEICISSTISKC